MTRDWEKAEEKIITPPFPFPWIIVMWSDLIKAIALQLELQL
ncbi:MAG TPA: hypothetical protein V6D25_17660 [Leptolyngbyaceae cyanobacterium]